MVGFRIREEGKPGNEGPQTKEDGESPIRGDTHGNRQLIDRPGDSGCLPGNVEGGHHKRCLENQQHGNSRCPQRGHKADPALGPNSMPQTGCEPQQGSRRHYQQGCPGVNAGLVGQRNLWVLVGAWQRASVCGPAACEIQDLGADKPQDEKDRAAQQRDAGW